MDWAIVPSHFIIIFTIDSIQIISLLILNNYISRDEIFHKNNNSLSTVQLDGFDEQKVLNQKLKISSFFFSLNCSHVHPVVTRHTRAIADNQQSNSRKLFPVEHWTFLKLSFRFLLCGDGTEFVLNHQREIIYHSKNFHSGVFS